MKLLSLVTIVALCSPMLVHADSEMPPFPIYVIHVAKRDGALRVGINADRTLTTVRAEGVETECTTYFTWISLKKHEKFSVIIRVRNDEDGIGKEEIPTACISVDREGPEPRIRLSLPRGSVYSLCHDRREEDHLKPKPSPVPTKKKSKRP